MNKENKVSLRSNNLSLANQFVGLWTRLWINITNLHSYTLAQGYLQLVTGIRLEACVYRVFLLFSFAIVFNIKNTPLWLSDRLTDSRLLTWVVLLWWVIERQMGISGTLILRFGRITELFSSVSLSRGCLFYGPPGTGKTLVARALANECSHGNRKVAFFMRKGADCLSKWVGESERQLRLLFEQVMSCKHGKTDWSSCAAPCWLTGCRPQPRPLCCAVTILLPLTVLLCLVISQLLKNTLNTLQFNCFWVFFCDLKVGGWVCVGVCRPQAYQMRPSIIFFDEIDGLAPVRSSRQDQIHRSEKTATNMQEYLLFQFGSVSSSLFIAGFRDFSEFFFEPDHLDSSPWISCPAADPDSFWIPTEKDESWYYKGRETV